MSDSAVSVVSEPADLPPGAAPQFGEVEPHALPAESPLILSALAERHESGLSAYPAGSFALDDIPATGSISILASPVPGLVHIDADIAFARGGVLHYEADVRESWVARTAVAGDSAPASLVRALADLARIPRQSTVRVHFEA